MRATADDWPRWMGPLGTGVAPATGIFPQGGPISLGVQWRLPLGRGYSSVSVADGRAYTLASNDFSELLVAIDVHEGRVLWSLHLDASARESPSSTPAVDGHRVFALSSHGQLYAVDVIDGAPIWSHDLGQVLGAVPPAYGMSTSPLIVDDLVVVLVGGRDGHNLVAFDKASGEIVWSVSHATRGSYASPALLEINGERQIVVPADDLLYAVRPVDGGLLWSHGGLGSLDRIPLLLPDNRLLLARETRAALLRLSRDSGIWQVEEVWQTEAIRHSYSPAVHLEGVIYGFDDRYLTCLDAASGEVRWRQQVGAGSLILVDRHLVVLSADSGLLRLIAADPDGFEERTTIQALATGNGAFAPPSFAGRRIFLRNKSEIAALGIAVE